MAEIAPFRGVLYDPTRVPAEKVLAPPYDVIHEADRARLEAEHPRNVVRLILPRPDAGGDDASKYAHAARDLDAWLAEGTLVRDDRPALYRYAQTFTAEGQTATRRGFIGLVRLARFEEGIVKPHERTLTGPKADRLMLKRATRCHLSQVFGLYSDPVGEVDRWFEMSDPDRPDIAGTTLDGVRQELWRVADPHVILEVSRAMKDRAIYIADGHHRYETMLALRDELRAANPDRPARSAVEYGTIFLANMDDPSLLVFPTHRLIHSLPGLDTAKVLAGARAWFAVEAAPGELGGEPAAAAARVRDGLRRRGEAGPTVALALPKSRDVHYLTLTEAGGRELPGPAVLRTLDVTVLHGLLIERLLGIDRAAQAAQTNIEYVKDTAKAVEQIVAGGCQLAFLMNPTKVGQVREVADAGEVMPQKSTFFYPKLASGLVMNRIDPAEAIMDPLSA